MKTVFGLFVNIAGAQKGVDELLAHSFDKKEMNAVVQESAAKLALDINRHESTAEKGFDETSLRNLDSIFVGKHPITISDAGSVYASGTIAFTLAKTAAARTAGGFEEVLMDFGVPVERASAYRDAVAKGQLLLMLRTEDERVMQAAGILEMSGALLLLSIP